MLITISIISLIIIGLALVVLEIIFIPGTTIVGILGLICIMAGILMTFTMYGSTTGWLATGGTTVLSGAIFIYAFRTGAWKRFALKQSINSRVNDSAPIRVEIGDEGIALSTLRPMGKAEFNNQVVEVTSHGELVESGATIKVIKISNRKIIVEPINK